MLHYLCDCFFFCWNLFDQSCTFTFITTSMSKLTGWSSVRKEETVLIITKGQFMINLLTHLTSVTRQELNSSATFSISGFLRGFCHLHVARQTIFIFLHWRIIQVAIRPDLFCQ